MKRITAAALAILILSLTLAGCAAKTPDEKIYALTKELDAVYLVGADGAEKVYDLPDGAITAAVSGGTLWYADETALVRLDLADLSRREYELPENNGVGFYMSAEENEAYVMLCTGRENTGAVYRIGESGTERITKEQTLFLNTPFVVDGGSVYHVTGNDELVREDADGALTVFERPAFPLNHTMSLDGGRVYTCWAADCRSYDAATGGGERIETGVGGEALPNAKAHDGWLYYFGANYENRGSDDVMRLMAKRISDGRTVEYARTADLSFYAFDRVVTFGERGLVINDGYEQNDFRYVLYYTGK